MIPRRLATFLIIFAGVSGYAETGRRVTQLAAGVYAIEHPAAADGNVNGNTTVIIGERQVFVVDSCYTPSAARDDIAQIRKWTSKPVAFVLNTHFHNDHNNGNHAYVDAYPSVSIVAQLETKRDMDLIQPGNIERAPKMLATQIAAFRQGKYPNGRALSVAEKKEAEQMLPGLARMEEDLRSIAYESPTLTFVDSLEIDLGNRVVQVLHLGRGNTPGDAVVYLPKEKILIAGDLLVHPIPYTFDGYPAEWARTLDKAAQLDFETLVPGHGAVLHGKQYAYLVRDLMNSVVEQMRARIRQIGHPGFHSVDDVKEAIDLSSFRSKFAGDNKDLQAEFDEMARSLVKVAFTEAAQR